MIDKKWTSERIQTDGEMHLPLEVLISEEGKEQHNEDLIASKVSPNRLGTKYRADFVDKALASTSSDNIQQTGSTPTQTSNKMFNQKPLAVTPDYSPDNNESPDEVDERFS